MIRRSDIRQHTKYVSAPAADSGNHHQLRSLSSSSRLLPRYRRDETSCLPRPDLLVSACSWFWRSTRSNPNPGACSRRSRSQPHRPSLHRRWFRRFHVWIASVVRCAPPGDKPLPQEIRNCGTHLAQEIQALPRVRVVVCLGKIAFDGYMAFLLQTGVISRKSDYSFSHGAEYLLPNGLHLLVTYHPSLRNTNTGRLNRVMFTRIFLRARELAGLSV